MPSMACPPLRDDFLRRVFRGTFAPPRFLATTATLPVEYLRDMSFLTTVLIRDDAVIRGDRESMAQKLNIFQTDLSIESAVPHHKLLVWASIIILQLIFRVVSLVGIIGSSAVNIRWKRLI